MSTAERFENDKLSISLLNNGIQFKKIYFAANWAHYDTAVPSTLRIVPNPTLQGILQKDYAQMKEMFPDTRLSFDEILTKLEVLQRRVNGLKGP